MDIVYKGFIKRMEKANNDMMMDENSRSWYVLYTAPRLERKLMQHLTVAGYKTYCPMQTIYVNWNGKTKEIIVPFFSGCVFVEGDLKDMTSVVASQKAAFLVNADGKELTIVSDKANLPGKFAQLLISEELLDSVSHEARESSRLRMNYNFHESLDSPIHRLLNALEPGTYLPPHRHTDKEETYVVLRGSLLTFFYDDLGNVIEKVNLNPSAGVYGVEIPSGTWHSIIALEPGTVIFEIKSGPYKPLPPEDIAPWAPAPSDLEGAAVFMKRMLEV